MPLYEVFHVTPLSAVQQGTLASAITKIHARQFRAPTLFVNVVFHDVAEQPFFVGGKPKRINRIGAHVRYGPSRRQEDFGSVAAQIQDVWSRCVSGGELSTIFFFGSIVAGIEKGFSAPPAGEDAQWIRANFAAFKDRAAAGDGDFVQMLDEVALSGDFGDLFTAEELAAVKTKYAAAS